VSRWAAQSDAVRAGVKAAVRVAMSDVLWAVSRDGSSVVRLAGRSERHWALLLAGRSVLLSAAQTVVLWAGQMAGRLAGLWVEQRVARTAGQMVHCLAAGRAALTAFDSAVHSAAAKAERWEQRWGSLLASS
jgi:hypothetical protein